MRRLLSTPISVFTLAALSGGAMFAQSEVKSCHPRERHVRAILAVFRQ
jgi:hypothetical protein